MTKRNFIEEEIVCAGMKMRKNGNNCIRREKNE
jgi:hypothetical protein